LATVERSSKLPRKTKKHANGETKNDKNWEGRAEKGEGKAFPSSPEQPHDVAEKIPLRRGG
jgi:hypothetical protein